MPDTDANETITPQGQHEPCELPFQIETRITDRRGTLQYIATRNGKRIAGGKYAPLDIDKRAKLAKKWATNKALLNGATVTVEQISEALEEAELDALDTVDEVMEGADEEREVEDTVECAAYIRKDTIAELAWNYERKEADFIVYDRVTGIVSRPEEPQVDGTRLVPPSCSRGIVTPGGYIPGSVLVPSAYDESGIDEDRLRQAVELFIRRYVEFSDDTTALCVEYVLLTYVHDDFDELAYLAFRTVDLGRGKSRALEEVGAICYRPILCGGGSTAAATLRLLHHFGGTLLADEYDQRDTELASELVKLINQGFQANRPLVRCDGERNMPKPFRCFGPKLFALRKGFADDATESRIISIRMRQRTRRDIPISLPRARFDREALALRNRLLAWRFANLGKITVNPAHADPRLEDRNNQIGLPLMAVAGTAEGRERVVNALVEQQKTIAADRADTLAGEVFEVVLSAVGEDGIVRPKDVTRIVNENRAAASGITVDKLGKRAVNPWKVGRVLAGDLELRRLKKDEHGARYLLDATRMEQLCRRLGVDPAQTSETSKRQSSAGPSAEDPLFDSASRVSDVPDVPDVSPDVPGGSPQTSGGNGAAESGVPSCGLHEFTPEGKLVVLRDRLRRTDDPGQQADVYDQMATACEVLHPDKAAEYQRQAAAIREAVETP